MAKQIQLWHFGSGFGHLISVLRSGLSASTAMQRSTLWLDKIGTSLGGLIGISNKNRVLNDDIMKNIVLDIIMGLICLALVITIFGIVFIPDILEQWADMRTQ